MAQACDTHENEGQLSLYWVICTTSECLLDSDDQYLICGAPAPFDPLKVSSGTT
jgi:hypothetical protein